jgi:hypothetical protein
MDERRTATANGSFSAGHTEQPVAAVIVPGSLRCGERHRPSLLLLVLLTLTSVTGCGWHYVVVANRDNNGPGFDCALSRSNCFATGGPYGFYKCQTEYYMCLRDLPGAVTFVVRGKRDSSLCSSAGIAPPVRCTTEEYADRPDQISYAP